MSDFEFKILQRVRISIKKFYKKNFEMKVLERVRFWNKTFSAFSISNSNLVPPQEIFAPYFPI